MKKKILCLVGSVFLSGLLSWADIPLIGCNIPNESLLDGDFENTMSGWRQYRQSAQWAANAVKGRNRLGLAEGRISSGGNAVATYESPVLDHTAYQKIKAGDQLVWRFASNAQYPCDGRISFSLVFGTIERVVLQQASVPTGPQAPRIFDGVYTVSAEDAAQGLPFARFTMQSDYNINVYVDWVDLKVLRDETAGPRELDCTPAARGALLSWSPNKAGATFNIYRSDRERKGFKKIAGGVSGSSWNDESAMAGRTYFYAVSRAGKKESSTSPVIEFKTVDAIAPLAPQHVTAIGNDWDVELSWESHDKDLAEFNVLRGDSDGKNFVKIASHVTQNRYIDTLPVKGVVNSYAIEAVDFSGNTGPASVPAQAKVKTVPGASFSDLIRPMPVHKGLRSDLWGAENVLPRDPENGIEHPDWSYWGGRPMKDRDGKYHMLVVRWPEGDRKGHWEWPASKVVHSVSDEPGGPYVATHDAAYEFAKGKGHNADVTKLNDGRFLLYVLSGWKPMLFTSKSMNGPWHVEGEMKIEYDADTLNDPREYQVQRNLSGVQLDDGSMLFVTKFGRMIKSETGLLGPYKVLTDEVKNNPTLPGAYQKSGYEDPVMWRDDVQFHQIINAFLDYRAIYLRSPDGIHWKYDAGLAYTPRCTRYEDGTRTSWYKLERPHVIQDEFGRATHLSLAAIDVEKRQDFAKDGHNSKNIIMPLIVPKRITMRNSVPVTKDTPKIAVLIHSEKGFDPVNELDLTSLRIGASEEVNYGRGAKAYKINPVKGGAVVLFKGAGNGITEKNFACKLIGKTNAGELIVGFSKLVAE